MEVSSFEEIQSEFLRRVSNAIYCSVATMDRKNRPNSRMMHPVWDGHIGWVISWPQSHKAKHLQGYPYVSLAYIEDRDKPVYVDARADWINEGEKNIASGISTRILLHHWALTLSLIMARSLITIMDY